jgi:hypothetical protein
MSNISSTLLRNKRRGQPVYNGRMNKRRASFARHAWIAVMAILLNVLAPAFNHLLPTASAAQPLELCTSHGVQLVADAGHAPGKQGAPLHAGNEHCAYCGVHAASHAAIPPSPAVVLAQAGGFGPPSLFYQSPRLLFAWTLASSRAPPVTA